MENKSVIFLFLAGLAICYGAAVEENVPLEEDVLAEANSNRILAGSQAVEGQFPFMVSIQMLGAGQALPTRGHRCGGVLITLSHVLTAANCLFDVVGGVQQPVAPAQIRVFAGSILLTNDTSPDRIRPVANFTIHPDFTGFPALVNNIAVVTLGAPFSAEVGTPIALPREGLIAPDFTMCTVSGFGGNAAGESASEQLRFTNKYVFNQNLCMTIYNSLPHAKNILPSMVCAVSLDLLSSNCDGDDGNPLVCAGTLTGVLSQSDGCTRSTLPEIYTRISNHTRWIRTISGSPTLYAPGVFVLIALFSVMQIFFKA